MKKMIRTVENAFLSFAHMSIFYLSRACIRIREHQYEDVKNIINPYLSEEIIKIYVDENGNLASKMSNGKDVTIKA